MQSLTARQSLALRQVFGFLVVGLGGLELTQVRAEAFGPLLLGAAVAVLALLPTYLWVTRRVTGLPIFPVMAVTYLWTFALPLWNQPVGLARYAAEAQVSGGGAAALFLAVATGVWFTVARRPSAPPRALYLLDSQRGQPLFLACLAGSIVFEASLNAQWLPIPWWLMSITRAVSLSLVLVAVAVLSNRLGERRLTGSQALTFLTLLVVYLLVNIVALLLIGALSIVFLAVIMYAGGRGRLPVGALVAALLCFSILHLGKADMRARYWGRPVPVWDYPTFFAEWCAFGLAQLTLGGTSPGASWETSERSSLVDRAALLQMVLLVQSRSPDPQPYLQGETYLPIPGLLIPRLLNPNKPRSHEGTYLLAIYYGLQTEDATYSTTIAFGLLAEAYANFGWSGVVLLGLIAGGGTGMLTRWARPAPLLSLRGLLALVSLPTVLQAEHTAGVAVAALFQASLVLVGFSVVTMRLQPLRRPSATP